MTVALAGDSNAMEKSYISKSPMEAEQNKPPLHWRCFPTRGCHEASKPRTPIYYESALTIAPPSAIEYASHGIGPRRAAGKMM